MASAAVISFQLYLSKTMKMGDMKAIDSIIKRILTVMIKIIGEEDENYIIKYLPDR